MNKVTMRSLLRSVSTSSRLKFQAASSASPELKALSGVELTVDSVKIGKGRGGTVVVSLSSPTGETACLSTKCNDLIDHVELD